VIKLLFFILLGLGIGLAVSELYFVLLRIHYAIQERIINRRHNRWN
jgi:hypothetical protein